MGTRISFAEVAERAKNYNPVPVTKKVIEANPKPITDAVKEQLYTTGENKDGQKLPKYKNQAYARKKHKMNPQVGLGIPDYRLTGDLYNRMSVTAGSNAYEVKSDVPYFEYVEKRDKKAFDMNNENAAEYKQEILYPELRKDYKDHLLG